MAAILLCGCVGAGFVIQNGGARSGREYIRENVSGAQEDSRKTEAGESRGGSEQSDAERGQKEGDQPGAEAGPEGPGHPGAGAGQPGSGTAGEGAGQPGSEADQKGAGQPDSGKGGQSADQPAAASSEIVMLFAGDVYFSSHVLNAYDKAGGIQGVLDEGIRAEIENADIFMVNQEFPFTERGTAAADKQFTFRLPESRINLMKEMGVDIVTLANNHILDFGTEGLLDSCEALDKAGILYVGGGPDFDRASKLETIVIGQKTIGFLGTSRVYMDAGWAAGDSHPGVFSTYDTTLPLKAIEKAREECDYLVVYVHWGVEREETPKDYQRAMGQAYIDAGADLVVGSHPHVLQPVEEYKGKTIVYSLGNFVFGSSIPKTALLKVVWGEDGTRVSMIPCTSSGGYTRLAQ